MTGRQEGRPLGKDGLEQVGDRQVRRRQDHRKAETRGQRHGLVACQRMVRPHHRAQPELREKELLQFGRLAKREGDADIHLAAGDGAGDIERSHDDDREGDARRAGADVVDRLGKDRRSDALCHRDRDMADPRAVDVLDVGARPLQILEHRDDMARQRLADRRQHEARGQPVEQRLPDFLFQLDDLAVHRRGSDVELSRRLPDRFGAAHGIEVADGGGMDAQGQKSILTAPDPGSRVSHRTPQWKTPGKVDRIAVAAGCISPIEIAVHPDSEQGCRHSREVAAVNRKVHLRRRRAPTNEMAGTKPGHDDRLGSARSQKRSAGDRATR